MRYILLLIIFSLTAISVYPQASSEKLMRKGVSLHDQGKYTEAISYYQQALQINPGSMSAIYEMSLSYLHLKDYDNALKYSTKVINANFLPLLVDAYCVKSSALAELNKYDQSIKLLTEAIERCGDEYLLHYNLGLSYFKKKDLRLAVSHLGKAIEIDTTHPSAFLLYAYTLNDSGKWLQALFSFHFFLLQEPNTERSKEAFNEMYDILTMDLPSDSPKLEEEDGIGRRIIYDYMQKNRPATDDPARKFLFIENVTKKMILTLSQMQDESQKGLLWDFFLPIYSEILASGYIDVYCHYISVSQFPSSLEWWNKNTDKVDQFISWFEGGQDGDSDEELGDDSED
ncbi:tetratricopeptide repeat protein [Viscerimonas tarda]